MEIQSANTVSTPAVGAAVRNYYFTRSMNFYPVTDGEMDSLGALNMEANICLAVGVGLVSIAAGVAITHAFTEKTSAVQNLLCYAVAPLLMILGGIALWACWKFNRRRDALWNRVTASAKAAAINPGE